MQDVFEKAKHIKLLICDIDGVMTDGGLFFGDDGQEYKAFHARDGHGIKMLQRNGVELAVITGRTSQVVVHRMKNLNIQHIYQGKLEKLPSYEELVAELGYSTEQVAYAGDDVVDLPVMRRVGLAIAVADAHELVKQHAHWTTPHPGGHGAVRDICEVLMKAQGTYDAEMQRYIGD